MWLCSRQLFTTISLSLSLALLFLPYAWFLKTIAVLLCGNSQFAQLFLDPCSNRIKQKINDDRWHYRISADWDFDRRVPRCLCNRYSTLCVTCSIYVCSSHMQEPLCLSFCNTPSFHCKLSVKSLQSENEILHLMKS